MAKPNPPTLTHAERRAFLYSLGRFDLVEVVFWFLHNHGAILDGAIAYMRSRDVLPVALGTEADASTRHDATEADEPTATRTLGTLAAGLGITFTENRASLTVHEQGKADRRVLRLKDETTEQTKARVIRDYHPHTSAEYRFANQAALGNDGGEVR
ncbi:hypothetical protein ABGB17_20250 [Sphaerisporangium sp. B11E5]|uniref:hypothetical protein n=1 Tax=Sphaerisporangium sp. B11E5 TaxID=3153563 RepID=UPI00325DAFA9